MAAHCWNDALNPKLFLQDFWACPHHERSILRFQPRAPWSTTWGTIYQSSNKWQHPTGHHFARDWKKCHWCDFQRIPDCTAGRVHLPRTMPQQWEAWTDMRAWRTSIVLLACPPWTRADFTTICVDTMSRNDLHVNAVCSSPVYVDQMIKQLMNVLYPLND